MKSSFVGMLTALLLAAALQSQAQTYAIRDLGAVAGESASGGYGLNLSGQAVGVSSSPKGDIATLFSNGQALNLGTLEPLDVSVATAINGPGQVVGYEPLVSDPNGVSHAWLYSNGKLTDINSASLFPSGSRALGINASGEVVGQGQLNAESFHAFLYSNGRMVDIGPPGAYQATAVAINDAGQVVGSYYISSSNEGAFLYANGKFTSLGAPAGATTSATAVNSVGQISGTIYFNSGAPPHAAVYSSGAWTDLGGVAGVATHGVGINTAGQVIATAYFPVQSYHPFRPGKHVGYIVRQGALVDLNTLIPTNSGFTITDAIAINEAGEILCDATVVGPHQRAVLLSPK